MVSVSPSPPLLVPGADALDIEPALAAYRRDGYARLGVVAREPCLAALRARTEDLMLGRVRYPGLFFQIDAPSGRYEDLTYGRGWEGPSLGYRKIEKLEKDPLFWAYMTNPLFERIARAVLGDGVVLYRAVVFAKAPRAGSPLPWHQDGGLFWGLSEDPVLQIWTALDDAPAEAGCLEVLPGSHERGLATRNGGVVPANHVDAAGADLKAVPLPAVAGDALLIHNHVWHRSGPNVTDKPRRGFTVCFMKGSTRCLRTKRAPRRFVPVFPPGPPEER